MKKYLPIYVQNNKVDGQIVLDEDDYQVLKQYDWYANNNFIYRKDKDGSPYISMIDSINNLQVSPYVCTGYSILPPVVQKRNGKRYIDCTHKGLKVCVFGKDSQQIVISLDDYIHHIHRKLPNQYERLYKLPFITADYIGVYPYTHMGKEFWIMSLQDRKGRKLKKLFDPTEEGKKAAELYDFLAIEIYGKDATTNFNEAIS